MTRAHNFLKIKAFSRTTEAGSRTTVWAVTGAPHRELELHGKYLFANEILEPRDFVLSADGMAMQRKARASDLP